MSTMQPDQSLAQTGPATQAGPAPSPRSGLIRAAGGGLAAILLLNLTVFGRDPALLPAALVAMGVFLAGVALLWVKLPGHYPHARFGGCNTVTLFRAGLGASLIAPLLTGASDPVTAWSVVVVAVIALSLDGLDGWLARRSGLVSGFGARFDMEVDAALALLLSLHALKDGLVGPVVLVLGVMRYLFVAASWALPWMAAPLPDSFGRKVVCVIQIAALIALQLPLLTALPAQIIVLGASAALLWSFGRDTLWLWRHR
jgi:phosphatidylglycerophosphate synthase